MASSAPSSAGKSRTVAKGSVGSAGSRTPNSQAAKGSQSDSKVKANTSIKGKPSDKLNPKTIDPFTHSTKKQSAFAAVYSNGGVPCRLVHGSVKNRLHWDMAPEQASFDPLLITLAEGLRETVHPYTFVARTGFKELLEVPHCGDRVVPILAQVVTSIRAALAHSDSGAFQAGVEALVQLSDVVGPSLNIHLKTVLASLCKKIMDKRHRDQVTDALQRLEQNGGREALPIIKAKLCKKIMDKRHRDQVTDALQRLEQNGGREALPIIKAKVPTYSSIFG